MKFREDYDGLSLLVNVIDAAIFGGKTQVASGGGQEVIAMESQRIAMETNGVEKEGDGVQTSTPSSETSVGAESSSCVNSGGSDEYSLPLPPIRGSMNILTDPLSEERMGWVSEAMKVVFNQTVHWKEEGQFTEVSYPHSRTSSTAT